MNVYVLDDAADTEVGAMAHDFDFRYVVRPNRGWFKKAGNLHHAFGITGGDHILILDADFAPRADLLDELLPYMDADERVGIVQSPQFFRHHRPADLDRARRGSGAGAVLPVRADLPRGQGRIDLRRLVRGVPARGPRPDRRHHADRALRGHVHRFRPAGAGLEAALRARRAVGRCAPGHRRCLPQPAVPLVHGLVVAADQQAVLEMDLKFQTRLCYVSGFLDHLQTALATFLAPLIPLGLLILRPDLLRAEASLWVLPSVVMLRWCCRCGTGRRTAWRPGRFG